MTLGAVLLGLMPKITKPKEADPLVQTLLNEFITLFYGHFFSSILLY